MKGNRLTRHCGRIQRCYRLLVAIAWLLCCTVAVGQPTSVSGTLGAVGSDTMAGLMLRWGEALDHRYPDINLQFQAGGSASAPTALVAGTTRFGPMSRPMSDTERQQFIERYGYPPRELKVARDALLLVVHRHNPLASLTREQADAIFSTSLDCGGLRPIRRWEQLLPSDQWPYGKIALHGRNLASGTHGLFQNRALCNGQFRRDISEHPGSSAVIAAVGESPNAMGYAGYNHLNPMVRALPLIDDTGHAIRPSVATIQDDTYPLSRDLYLYVNLPPGDTLPPAEQAFIELIFSEEGQQIVQAAGFVPLPQAQRQPPLLAP
ncbi:PstS family phosphate ABC transporter substrate-binding protein [Vreelandella aquamarina]|uniref:PstS family phosphate ABC transporter substrate-binding protein n=1 Tax=Vreelandella aquamarina TaxID=77097 RepID=UPI0020C2F310|nr:PstS family phosphate ABC transporter substrate-binding protein [Halomonas meridiana]